ncbi:MAG: hypothetical protein CMD21_01240 [Flavobacteriales bacterium]|nr:hypothetical protein [Flavobacteriales bacterium]
MKKLRPLLLVMLLSSLATFSQNKKTNYNSIYLGADFSSIVFLGDIKQHDFYPSSYVNFNEFRFSGALNAKKMFNNADLAKRRAQSAINYLVEAFGIYANRFEVVSKEEINPLVLKQGFDTS